MYKNIAFIGNPNSGKTTLFNAVTGTYQKTGNWTGVTTEKKIGKYKKDKSINVVDLPGIYGLTAGSDDENAVLLYIKTQLPQVIINVVDGTNLERNLALTLQLLSLNVPLVIAVNFYDQLLCNNIKLNINSMEEALGVKVVPVSAIKNINIELLMKEAVKAKPPKKNIDLSKEKGETISQKRFSFIESKISMFINKKTTRSERFTLKADDILTHKIWGIPILIAVITLIYFLSIKIGGSLGDIIISYFSSTGEKVRNFLQSIKTPEWITSLVYTSIFSGVGTVLSFLPQVLVLFLLMTFLEQSGYASRIAFNLDRMLRGFGLGGKSVIPMIVSCGCTVTGLTATRTIENQSEKKMTIYLCPFMPCSAKMAVFGWFASRFFGGRAIIATMMYLISVLSVAIFGKILKGTKEFKRLESDFILEMPSYRLPAVKDFINVLIEKTKEFLVKAGSVIFLVSILIWFLLNFGFTGYTKNNIEFSFLYYLGNLLKYIFYPLGFGNWQATVALLSGIMAKEAIIETLEIVCVSEGVIFESIYSVCAFMCFILLSPPCIASIKSASNELKNKASLLKMLFFQTITAYTVALLVNGIGILIERNLIFSTLAVIIILVLVIISIKAGTFKSCKSCRKCSKGEGGCRINIKRNTI